MHSLTRSCFFLLSPGRLFLLAFPFLGTPLLSPWNARFPLHALTLISLFLAKVWLSLTLTLSNLMIWCFGLFLLLLAKATVVYLPTAVSVAPRPLFPSQQVQYTQASLLKPVPFCTLFAGLGSTNKSTTSLLFSFYLALTLSSPPYPLFHLSFYLKLSD